MIIYSSKRKRRYYREVLTESRLFFIYFLLLIVSFSCNISSRNKSEEKIFSFNSDKPGMVFKLENSGKTEACFTLKLNQSNFNSENEILEKISKMEDEFPNEL